MFGQLNCLKFFIQIESLSVNMGPSKKKTILVASNPFNTHLTCAKSGCKTNHPYKIAIFFYMDSNIDYWRSWGSFSATEQETV